MRNLASSEVDGRFDFVTLVEYSGRMILFEVIVVLVSPRPEFYLLDRDNGLLSLCFLLFLLLLVLPLAKIDDAANGRSRLWRDLD